MDGYATHVTYEAGAKVRIYEQTASRDYDAVVVPGTYPVRYTDVNHHPVSDGERPYYGCVDVMIDTPTRRQSSVEFGGVPLAFETIEGGRRPHTIRRYAYQMANDQPS